MNPSDDLAGRAYLQNENMLEREKQNNERIIDELLALFPEQEFSIKTVKFGQVCCVICQDSFSHRDPVRIVPDCLYAFHGCCLKMWWLSQIQQDKKCPICQQIVTGKPMLVAEEPAEKNDSERLQEGEKLDEESKRGFEDYEEEKKGAKEETELEGTLIGQNKRILKRMRKNRKDNKTRIEPVSIFIDNPSSQQSIMEGSNEVRETLVLQSM